jgi:hypothetical protein
MPQPRTKKVKPMSDAGGRITLKIRYWHVASGI